MTDEKLKEAITKKIYAIPHVQGSDILISGILNFLEGKPGFLISMDNDNKIHMCRIKMPIQELFMLLDEYKFKELLNLSLKEESYDPSRGRTDKRTKSN